MAEKPTINDPDVAGYVEKLERQLENYESEKTQVRFYLGLKKQMDDISELFRTFNMDDKAIASGKDKFFDRYLSLLDKADHISKSLEAMRKRINQDILKQEEEKYIKSESISVESMKESLGE